MKKIFIILLAVLMLAATLAACGDTTADTTPSGTEKPGEFVVTGEKYVYKNKDVLLLKVDNQTDKNYDVTAVVHYFDAEGNKIKSQKKIFAGWASGYQNYFLFQSNIKFETFTYDLELKEVEAEECYAKYITTEFCGLREFLAGIAELIMKGDFTRYSTISSEIKVENKATSTLAAFGYYAVIDKNGNMYSIEDFGDHYYLPHTEAFEQQCVYQEKTTEKLVWPDELTGDVTVIFTVTSVKLAQ